MVVNGASSKWAPVIAGVPQGTVLGPILFLLLKKDLPSSVSSRVKLFMDDRVLYRHIESSADHDKLQQDLLQLEEWVAMWEVISLLVNVISCPSPLSVSHSHCRTCIVTLP